MCRVRPVLGAAVAALLAGGCVTATAMKVGVVHEVPARVGAESGRPPGYREQVDTRRLVLVRASSGDGQRVGASVLAGRSCYYDRPWAPYARAALVPFAVVADIITASFQVLLLATLTSVAAIGK